MTYKDACVRLNITTGEVKFIAAMCTQWKDSVWGRKIIFFANYCNRLHRRKWDLNPLSDTNNCCHDEIKIGFACASLPTGGSPVIHPGFGVAWILAVQQPKTFQFRTGSISTLSDPPGKFNISKRSFF